ncbi:MAG: DUF234 domain-containing protein [Candidatus Njordarchaeales archaeon]
MGYIEDALSYIKDTLSHYLSNVFEDVVLELIPKLYEIGVVKTRPIEIGKWWYKGEEIDAVIRDPGKSTTFVEIKWRELDKEEALNTFRELEDKAARTGLMSPRNYYIIVTKKAPSDLEINEHRVLIDLKTLNKLLSE